MRGAILTRDAAAGRSVRAPGQSRVWRPGPRTHQLIAAGTVLAFGSINLFGQLSVLLFFAGTAAVVAFNPIANARDLIKFSPLLLIPIVAMISTIWSDAPQRTMRAALELLITFAAAILICRNLRPDRLLLAMLIAFAATIMTVLPLAPGSLAGHYPLVAWWGSKNSVGFAGYMVVALSLCVMFDRAQPRVARIASLILIPPGLLVAYLAQSGGSISTIALTVLIFPPLALLAAMKPPLRVMVIIFVLLLFGIACFFLPDINAAVADFRVNVLKKDATLTGRTYLWDFASRLATARPWLGYGYGAFWRQGNIDAEGLWRWGGIASRNGFNFHNAFVEMRIDMGLIGMGLLLAYCAIIGLAALVRQAVAPSVSLAGFIALVAVIYVHSYVEDGIVAPFSLATVIWVATFVYAVTPASADGLTPIVPAGEPSTGGPIRTPRRARSPLLGRGLDRRWRGAG
ncbi:O-antigen ligase family protein [Sphingomonas sp.]|uniref:O-antigen ligase family protein n=1 Tax=Sphingomonas sp. TaxID=28214 RepID=UPI003CC54B8B